MTHSQLDRLLEIQRLKYDKRLSLSNDEWESRYDKEWESLKSQIESKLAQVKLIQNGEDFNKSWIYKDITGNQKDDEQLIRSLCVKIAELDYKFQLAHKKRLAIQNTQWREGSWHETQNLINGQIFQELSQLRPIVQALREEYQSFKDGFSTLEGYCINVEVSPRNTIDEMFKRILATTEDKK